MQEQRFFTNLLGKLFSVLPRPLILQKAQEQSAVKINNLEILASQGLWSLICLQSYTACGRVGLGFLNWNFALLKPATDILRILQEQAVAKVTYRSQESKNTGSLKTHGGKYRGAWASIPEIPWAKQTSSFLIQVWFFHTIIVLSTSSWDSFVWCKSWQQRRS